MISDNPNTYQASEPVAGLRASLQRWTTQTHYAIYYR
jgi:hypothetical protein